MKKIITVTTYSIIIIILLSLVVSVHSTIPKEYGSNYLQTNTSFLFFPPTNNTAPSLRFHPSLKNQPYLSSYLFFNITAISEAVYNGSTKTGTSFNDTVIKFEDCKWTTKAFNKTSHDGNILSAYSFHSILPNNATIIFEFIAVTVPSSFVYGDMLLNSYNEMKFSVNITNWPLKIPLGHYLRIQVQFVFQNATGVSVSDDANFTYFEYDLDKMTVYYREIKSSFCDGDQKFKVRRTIEDASPTHPSSSYYFFGARQIYYDPDFSVLLKSDPKCLNDCSGNGDCIDDDDCQCYSGFSGSDCSRMFFFLKLKFIF
eukprot:TRINITY_DN1819_c0_g1_i6.p1 TRINITY_DN1819_c0_g1~~TRINITY_DN1819_c0_g1_i6.p1  ORF type:complete len:314 (+),score=42.92 TRINITY_DN1819_c0_g1_i6:230-1171(+)